LFLAHDLVLVHCTLWPTPANTRQNLETIYLHLSPADLLFYLPISLSIYAFWIISFFIALAQFRPLHLNTSTPHGILESFISDLHAWKVRHRTRVSHLRSQCGVKCPRITTRRASRRRCPLQSLLFLLFLLLLHHHRRHHPLLPIHLR